MQKMIDNLINGNLTDAKKQAKRFSQAKIQTDLFSMGWSLKHACAAACYLKNQITWEKYCEATK
jgi:hypothetical protein